MDPIKAAAELERRARLLGLAAPETMERSLELLLEQAQAHSRGPLQAADLPRLGHPYSRRRGARLNPNIVNRWTGAFERGWEIDGPHPMRDGLRGTVHNTDPKAAQMERGEVFGQRLMIERHPEEDALAAAARDIEMLWAELVRRVFG